MIKPRIIVTGATGKTGSVVASELLKAGYPVRAMVRGEDDRSAHLKAQGAEIAVAGMSDVERIADALRDVQGAYYCPPVDPYMIQGAVAFAVAAKEARLEHIVGMTQWLASFCSKTVKRAVVAGKNAQSRQSVFRWRRTAPFQKVIYMRPESLLSRRAETCRRTSCMAVKQGVSEESGEVRMQPCWCGAYFALLLAAE